MKYIFNCIDAHTCGNPVRLVKEGGPLLEGKNMSEKRQHFLMTLPTMWLFYLLKPAVAFRCAGMERLAQSLLLLRKD